MRFVLHIVSLVCFIRLSDANVNLVSVNSLDGSGSMKCGSQVILVCNIQPYNGTMSWKVDDTPVMSCTSGQCKTHPSGFTNFGFSFQSTKGIFNLTISPVTLKENGRTIACADESLSVVITPAVKVLPDNITTVIESTNTSKGMEIKATTACVYPAASLNFQWYYFQTGMSPELYTYGTQNDVPVNISTDECSTGDCGGDGVTKMSSALTFEEDPTGEEYYLQAVITSSDVPDSVVVTSNVTYKLSISEGDNSLLVNGRPATALIVALAVVGILILVTTVVVFLVCLRSADNPEKAKIIDN